MHLLKNLCSFPPVGVKRELVTTGSFVFLCRGQKHRRLAKVYLLSRATGHGHRVGRHGQGATRKRAPISRIHVKGLATYIDIYIYIHI